MYNFSEAPSFDRCVQVFYGFGDEKLVKMIDEVKVLAKKKLKSLSLTNVKVKVNYLKINAHCPLLKLFGFEKSFQNCKFVSKEVLEVRLHACASNLT